MNRETMRKFIRNQNEWWKLHGKLQGSLDNIQKQDEDNLKYIQLLKAEKTKKTKYMRNRNEHEEELTETTKDMKCLDELAQNYLDELEKCSENIKMERENLKKSFYTTELELTKKTEEASFVVQKTIDGKKLNKKYHEERIKDVQERFNQLYNQTMLTLKSPDTFRGFNFSKT